MSKEIKFNIELDGKDFPDKITWSASDSPEAEPQETKSIILSIWDHVEKNTLRIDLWTNDMRLDEMDQHFFQTMITLAETYQRATGSDIVVEEVHQFCDQLARKISAREQQKQAGGK